MRPVELRNDRLLSLPKALCLGCILAMLSGTTMGVGRPMRVMVDDSATRVLWQAPPHWRDPSQAQSPAETQIRVNVQLNLSAHGGKSGTLYLRLAPSAPEGVEVTWESGRWLRAGGLRPGAESVLLFGVLPRYVNDTISMTVLAPANLGRTAALPFTFEVEMAP